MIRGVVFDLDGLLVKSEEYWEQARRELVTRYGGRWGDEHQRAVMGANTRQWSRYLREAFGIPLREEEIAAAIIARMRALYHERLPLLPGAITTVRALAAAYPLAVASSSPPGLIRFVLAEMGVAECFQSIASSDEVAQGKPAPDVYLLACDRLGVAPAQAVAFEDSTAGIAAALAAGLRVIAVPNQRYPPDPAVLRRVDLILPSLEGFDPAVLARW
ncbi:MAG: HAD family phosphatase [Sphaerobacter sp.]|nr:HAD family phosphatase [Sphaerobacter sp.]